MKKLFLLIYFLLFFSVVSTAIFAEPQAVRLKDIGSIIEDRENQLIGFGLVVGLRNTGDSKNTVFTDMALTNLLKKLGITSPKEFSSRNTAAVMVTAALPAYSKKGQKIAVTVSSLGDSTSLVGGTLVITPLQGADMKTYAVAQGPVIVGGMAEQSAQASYYKNQSTVGRIPEGAIVEAEVPVNDSDQHNITLVIKNPNFITVSRAVKAIQSNGFPTAKAIDANTIKIPIADLDSSDIVNTIAKLENITFVPDASSRIIINSRTGTIVIGEMVRLAPVAISHGNISIRISNAAANAGGAVGGGFGAAQGGQPGQENEPIKIDEQDSKVMYLNPTSTLTSLVNALNELGATPKDLVSIIQALHESGSLVGVIEVL